MMVGRCVAMPDLRIHRDLVGSPGSAVTAGAALTPPPPADASLLPDEPAADTARAEVFDRLVHAWQGRFTASISPAAPMMAFFDWSLHLANAPGKQVNLVEKAMRKWVRLALYLSRVSKDLDCSPCIQPLPHDKRFVAPDWQQLPFSAIYQSFLLQQQWWHNATTGIRGIAPQHERMTAFAVRQMLDVFAPSNFLLTNPEVLRRTMAEGGQNFLRGAHNLIED